MKIIFQMHTLQSSLKQQMQLWWPTTSYTDTQTFPSKVPVLAKRRQSSVGGFLRARSPDPAQLSWLREPGANPQAPQVAQMVGREGARSHRLQLSGCRGEGRGEVHSCFKAWSCPVCGPRSLHSLFPGPPRSPSGPKAR